MSIKRAQVESMLNFLDGMKPDAIITMPSSWGPNAVSEVLLAWRQCADMPFIWRTWDCNGQCEEWTHKPEFDEGEWSVCDQRFPAFRMKWIAELNEDPNEWDGCGNGDIDAQVRAASQYLEWLPSTPDPRGER